MAAHNNIGGLGQVIGDHMEWYIAWCRLAFYTRSANAADFGGVEIQSPKSFYLWYQQAVTTLPQDQPVMDKLAVLHDQLHKLAKLILLKKEKNKLLPLEDFNALSAKFSEFILAVRQLERAFAVAASGLDMLTGLRSRVGMHEDLVREQNRFLRGGKDYCVAIMDIDHFKKINDTYGHDAGDKVLAFTADHIGRHLRVFDDAYRMGGEEFLLCLKEADLATGLAVLERLRESLANLPINLPDGRVVNVTASFGIATAEKVIGTEDLIHRADQALYRAKNGGRNCVVVAKIYE